MQSVLADKAVSVSELKKNPSAVIGGANGGPVAVLKLLENGEKYGYELVEALFAQIAPDYLGFTRRSAPFARLRDAVSLEDIWILREGERGSEAGPSGYALARLNRNILHISNLVLRPGVDAAEAVAALAERHERREQRLRDALKPVAREYEYVVVDCPPSLGILTLNGLVAAQGVIIPIQCEYYALEGLADVLRTIDLVRHGPNPRVAVDVVRQCGERGGANGRGEPGGVLV